MMDAAAEKGNIKQVEMLHIFAVCLQGIRIAITAGALLFLSLIHISATEPFFKEFQSFYRNE